MKKKTTTKRLHFITLAVIMTFLRKIAKYYVLLQYFVILRKSVLVTVVLNNVIQFIEQYLMTLIAI